MSNGTKHHFSNIDKDRDGHSRTFSTLVQIIHVGDILVLKGPFTEKKGQNDEYIHVGTDSLVCREGFYTSVENK